MTESLIEYLLKAHAEYTRMKPETVVKLQHMFPGCQKYTSCCDTHWHKKLENQEEHEREYINFLLEEAAHRKWVVTPEFNKNKPPEDFNKW